MLVRSGPFQYLSDGALIFYLLFKRIGDANAIFHIHGMASQSSQIAWLN